MATDVTDADGEWEGDGAAVADTAGCDTSTLATTGTGVIDVNVGGATVVAVTSVLASVPVAVIARGVAVGECVNLARFNNWVVSCNSSGVETDADTNPDGNDGEQRLLPLAGVPIKVPSLVRLRL